MLAHALGRLANRLSLAAQVDKIVGISAPADFIDRLESMAAVHHERLSVDVIRAYYFGARFLVEVEVVMPADMSVKDSHDIALTLQHRVLACCRIACSMIPMLRSVWCEASKLGSVAGRGL